MKLTTTVALPPEGLPPSALEAAARQLGRLLPLFCTQEPRRDDLIGVLVKVVPFDGTAELHFQVAPGVWVPPNWRVGVALDRGGAPVYFWLDSTGTTILVNDQPSGDSP